METRANYAAVGAFVFVMVLLAFGAVVWLAGGQLNAPKAYYRIYFSGLVSGMREGAAVEYNGVPVGKVEDIRIDPDNVALVRTTIAIDPALTIRKDAVATLQSNLSERRLLCPDHRRDAEFPAVEGRRQRTVSGDPLGALDAGQRRGFRPGAGEQAERDCRSVQRDSRREEPPSSQRKPQNLRVFTAGLAARNDDIAELAANANSATAAASKLFVSIEHSYAGPDGIGVRLTSAISDFDKVAKNLGDTNKQLQGALQDVRPGLRSFSEQTLNNVGSLVAEARQLVASANRVVTNVERDPMSLLFGDRREGYRPR